jgi:hypothetical protein
MFASSPENRRPPPGQDLIAGLTVIDDEPRGLVDRTLRKDRVR